MFLSRPRRFGKSLFMDTIHNLFEGNKELFENLYIYDKWNWEDKYPVIKISFSGGIRDKGTLYSELLRIIKSNQERLDVKCEDTDNINICFGELIEKTYQKHNKPVVVLIDEYDKPILDNLEQIEQAKIIRDRIRDFYTKIKDSDRYIKFAMLTGVSKFSKVSIFSGLNNLKDISLDKNYGAVCGYTTEDLNTKFQPYLQNVDKQEVQQWYNGYNFLGNEKVYNPYDILLFIDNDKLFRNYWFETGTPTFLINLIKQKNYFLPSFENIKVEENIANSFDIEDLNLEAVMLQSGYLTIKEVISDFGYITYNLVFPNKEVKMSFTGYLSNFFVKAAENASVKRDILQLLHTGSIQDLEPIIKRLFSSIAYNNFTNNYIENYEGFYASVLYAYFASLGVEIVAEDVTNQGRIDLTIKVAGRVFIFEFKVIDEDPLKQIKEKKYCEKYIDNEKEIFIVGIVFDRKERNIKKFKWKKIK